MPDAEVPAVFRFVSARLVKTLVLPSGLTHIGNPSLYSAPLLSGATWSRFRSIRLDLWRDLFKRPNLIR